MKIFLKNILLVLIIHTLLGAQAFASSRVDSVIDEDRSQVVYNISQQLTDINNQKRDLSNIEKNLRHTLKGQNIYLKIETVAGSILVVGVVIGSYKAHFPPGFRAMLGAYLTTTGISRGLIKLTDKDVKTLLDKILKLNVAIDKANDQLIIQMSDACEKNMSHPLCGE